MTTTESKPRVLALPGPELRARMFTPGAEQALADLADVTWNDSGEMWTSEQLAAVIGSYDGLITGWGSPRITPEVMAAATRLRIIAHSAGSVKFLVDEDVLRRVPVSSAAIAMSPAVAECALIMVMLGLRHLHEYDYGMRRGGHLWDGQYVYGPPHEIASATIGVVGAGGIGRIFIGMVTALGAKVNVYDPYIADEEAAAMGATRMALDELMAASPIVVNVAPVTPETRHMIGARQFSLMPDNGYYVNVGRAWTNDEQALLTELQSGRLRAGLDVYDEEPLPLEHPFRALPNVLLLPHIAGASVEARHRQGDCVVRDLTNAFTGQPLEHEVTLERFAILA